MATITTRASKGSPLTHQEMDDNFSNLNAATNPAGSNQEIQYNNSGTMGASSGLTYDGVSLKVNGNLESVYHNGDEGGEIFLQKPDTNTTLAAGVTIDIYRNKLRIFENGGTNRGAYIDLSTATAGVGSDLLAGGGGGGLADVVDDTTPQLGGDLDVNGHSITSASNGDIAITPNGTGAVIIDGNEFPQTQGAVGEVLTADGSGLVEWKLPQTITAQVYNADSVTINKGEPVYVFSSTGTQISVKRALNTGDATSAQTLGLANENITAGSTGIVICQGLLKNVDTSSYTAGQALYLGSTAGSITTTKPYAPNHLVYLGFVEVVNGSSGRIYVRTQNGYELDEIHDVNINHNVSIANKDYLVYNSSNSLWENRQLDIVNDTTPQLGGDLDVNGHTITSVSDNITLLPGTMTNNINGLFNNFGVSGIPVVYLQGQNEQTVYVSGLNSSGTPGAELSLDYSTGASLSGANITLQSTSYTKVGSGSATGTLTSNGAYNLVLNTNAGTNSGNITLAAGANGNITIEPNGTGDIYLNADTIRVGDSNANVVLTSNGTGNLVLKSGNANTGSISLTGGTSGDIYLTVPNISEGLGIIYLNGDAIVGDINNTFPSIFNIANTVSTTIQGEYSVTPPSMATYSNALYNNFGVSGIPVVYLQGQNEQTVYVSGLNSLGVPGAEVAIDYSTGVSLTGANISLSTSGKVKVGSGSAAGTLTSNGAQNLVLQTNSGTNSGNITLASGANGNITIEPNGTGDIYLNADTVRIGDSNANVTLTSNGSGNVVLKSGNANTGSITLSGGTSGDITLTVPNISEGLGEIYLNGDTTIGDINYTFPSTLYVNNTVSTFIQGEFSVTPPSMATYNNALYSNFGIDGIPVAYVQAQPAATLYLDVYPYLYAPPAAEIALDPSAGITLTTSVSGGNTVISSNSHTHITQARVAHKVYAIGNSGTSTLTPNATNGQVQTITATGNFTLSAFSSPVSGQYIKFIITQDGTGNRTLTSTMKFEGGSKTLSTAANAIDILEVWYIGTTYYASLTKGYA